MCTVTFIPKGRQYMLTSSRDEHWSRKPALPPAQYIVGSKKIFYPKDGHAGGTWIATDLNTYTLCLLNGGLVKHERKSNYKHSRGNIIPDFFQYDGIRDFMDHYHWQELEPFTLLMAESRKKLHLYELIWTGEETLFSEKDLSQNHIWSSATLYDADTMRDRQRWLKDWCSGHSHPDLTSMIQFHQAAGAGDKHNNILMERACGIKTVSITAIEKDSSTLEIIYKDMTHQRTTYQLFL